MKQEEINRIIEIHEMDNKKININKDLAYWENNAQEDYISTPISVLKYIQKLEDHVQEQKVIISKEDNNNTFLLCLNLVWVAVVIHTIFFNK